MLHVLFNDVVRTRSSTHASFFDRVSYTAVHTTPLTTDPMRTTLAGIDAVRGDARRTESVELAETVDR